ncbi:MAG: cytochrome d ubiquinol oxidase subunit II [Chlamydiae bacterium RIFCSPHIGHO2_12_FULL_49_11]|nr:MAG: cytochrome d ubiquinol oxidase subunit II [Chlamydiae bacterium RIFCSPHIGHO2_12_FULL_49_11]
MPVDVMQILVYLLLGVSIVFYVILDGFDLGVGSLQIFAGEDKNRRIFLNSIGPFWDGNEVWLIIIGGLLFVGFPDVYAVLFSGFYLLMMCLLAGIIFRAVAIEFRSKLEQKKWRYFWDFVFWLASIGILFGAGLLIGNIIRGLPVDADRELYYSFGALFNGYSILIGIMSIFLFAAHGSLFLLLKTEGKLRSTIHPWTTIATSLFYALFIAATIWTWTAHPHMTARFHAVPLLWLVPIALLIAMSALIALHNAKAYGFAFIASMVVITLLFVVFAIGYFPHLVISTLSDKYTLSLYNAASSPITLKVTLIIACVGIPLVLLYGWILYRTFRGTTSLHDHSY